MYSSDFDVYSALTRQQQWSAKFRYCERIRKEWLATVGTTRNRITCVYSPTLSQLVRQTFACVVVDEGTRLQGGFETDLASGVIELQPLYRIVLSATPIKGRLSQIFWLVWWVCGGHAEPHARWPYAGTEEDKQDFSKTYLIAEHNLTAQEEGRSSYKRLSPQVCNVHGLWKLFAPIILRRLKSDAGVPIVTKTEHIVRVPFGTQQKAVYEHHLHAEYLTASGHQDPGGRMSALRLAAAAPTSLKLKHAPSENSTTYRSDNEFTPKIGCALNLIQQIISRGEQVVVASFFNEPLQTLARLLKEAGVPFCTLDGNKSPSQRKPLSRQFKEGVAGGIAVNLASISAVAEGHNWFRCPNMIVLTYTWESDKMKQIIDRIWRLPSPKDVNVWKIICEGSVELRLDELSNEKNDAACLVLDGRLLAEHPKELSLWEIAQEAIENYDQSTRAIPEETIQGQWFKLKPALAQAALLFKHNTPSAAPADSLLPATMDALPFTVKSQTQTTRIIPRFQRGSAPEIPAWKRKLWLNPSPAPTVAR